MHRSENKYADALAIMVLRLGTIEEDMTQIPLEVKAKPLVVTKHKRSSSIQEFKQKLEDPKLKDLK